MTDFDTSQFKFIDALDASSDVADLGDNDILIYALTLRLGAEDAREFAANSLTDGGDDKKIDVCSIDIVTGRAVIAQGYKAATWGKESAKANKASDLNTAIAWLLVSDVNDLPERLKFKATELRDAIENKVIRKLDLIYVHNCHESDNVKTELQTVAAAAKAALDGLGAEDVEVSYQELGLESIEAMYQSLDKLIKVDDEIHVEIEAGIEHAAPKWNAAVVTVSGEWVHELYHNHGDNLFSANVRDFLGATERRGNINAEIKRTATEDPDNFWAFNNGITAITRKIHNADNALVLKGISIINGAQTTGALGFASKEDAANVSVILRIVECEEESLVRDMIKYNNTQNEIRHSDLRSNHPVQKRLRNDFEKYSIEYVIRRSGGRAKRNSISTEGIAPALCSFHGDMETAFRYRRAIFEEDSKFESVFPTEVCAEHIYLIQCAASALDNTKLFLKGKISSGTATKQQEAQYEVLQHSASKHFMLFVLGQSIEEVLGRKVISPVSLRARTAAVTPDRKDLTDCWAAVIKAILPLVSQIVADVGDSYTVTRSEKDAGEVAKRLKAQLEALEETIGPQFKCLRDGSEN